MRGRLDCKLSLYNITLTCTHEVVAIGVVDDAKRRPMLGIPQDIFAVLWRAEERIEEAESGDGEENAIIRVAALFVQPDGCYSGLTDVDPWPEHPRREAIFWTNAVVAHPPCQLWGAMAVVNYTRWGSEHNKPGNDAGCFAAALASVREFGGVLEHPAKTKHGRLMDSLSRLQLVGSEPSMAAGCARYGKSAYGHRANKATWLYYHGKNPPFDLRWERPIGTHQIGFRDQRGKSANKPTLSKRESNATPVEFRDELLRLAVMAHNERYDNKTPLPAPPG